MLNTIVLKEKDAIEALCYETENGGLGQDYIAFDYKVLKNNGFYNEGVKLVGATTLEEGMYAYLIQEAGGKKVYVHLDWIAKVNRHQTLQNLVQSKELIKITRKEVMYPATGEIKDVGTLPICDCGEMGTIQMHDGLWICDRCKADLVKINSYSFRPNPQFTGRQLKSDEPNPVWYGIEIEVSTNRDKLSKYMYNHKQEVYLKSDSSIRGSGYNAEIVTHPMSFNHLMNSGVLDELSDVPTDDKEKGNGLHVHISRTAFKDDRHYALFYFLIHKMEKLATKVGGRELTKFCKLRPEGKVHKKANEKGGSERGLFINETNENTIEARFFQSTTNPKRLKANIQLLESLIKYTKYHTKRVSSKGWYSYVKKHTAKYKELEEVLGNIDVKSLTDKVTYKEPTLVTKRLSDCTFNELKNIVNIIPLDGSEIARDNITLRDVRYEEQCITLLHRGVGLKVYFKEIASVVIEKE